MFTIWPEVCLSWQIWDLASGKLKLSLTGHISTVRGVAISNRSPYLFSCGEDKQVKCWDLEYNKVKPDVTGRIYTLQFYTHIGFVDSVDSGDAVLGHQALPRTPQCCVWFRPASNYRRTGDVQQRCHSEGKLTLGRVDFLQISFRNLCLRFRQHSSSFLICSCLVVSWPQFSIN